VLIAKEQGRKAGFTSREKTMEWKGSPYEWWYHGGRENGGATG
jgi:hypothetical protein